MFVGHTTTWMDNQVVRVGKTRVASYQICRPGRQHMTPTHVERVGSLAQRGISGVLYYSSDVRTAIMSLNSGHR